MSNCCTECLHGSDPHYTARAMATATQGGPTGRKPNRRAVHAYTGVRLPRHLRSSLPSCLWGLAAYTHRVVGGACMSAEHKTESPHLSVVIPYTTRAGAFRITCARCWITSAASHTPGVIVVDDGARITPLPSSKR